MHDLQIGRIHYQVPATWNELKRKQLLAILPLLRFGSDPYYRQEILAVLIGVPVPLVAAIHPVQKAQLLPLTDFLFADDQRLTKQLLPTLDTAGHQWHGPRDGFRNLLFGEFIFADTFFVQYAKHQRPEHLHRFLAVLYRLRRRGASGDPTSDAWQGDVREPFNEHLIERRSSVLSRVSAAEQYAVLTWYRGCRASLVSEFPEVFDVADEDATAAKSEAPDWGRVLRKLSGGAFGTIQQTAGQHLRTILAEMQDAAREYQKLKASSSTR